MVLEVNCSDTSLDPDELCTLIWGHSPVIQSFYCSFATLKGFLKTNCLLTPYNSVDVWVGHCLAPNQTYCRYEEPGPSMNVASNKSDLSYVWIENSKM
jgi:hypothetical protein